MTSLHAPDTCFKQAHILTIRFGKNIKQPEIFGYYKGYRLNFEGDMCIFDESKSTEQFILVVTEQVKISTQSSGILYLERLPKKDCRLFYIKKKYAYKTNSANIFNGWVIEEEEAENIPNRLPDNSLILLISPKFIEKIKTNKQIEKQAVKMVNAPITYLPAITIKKSITQKELDNSCQLNILGALDTNALHAQIKNTKRLDNRVVLSQRSYVNMTSL